MVAEVSSTLHGSCQSRLACWQAGKHCSAHILQRQVHLVTCPETGAHIGDRGWLTLFLSDSNSCSKASVTGSPM